MTRIGIYNTVSTVTTIITAIAFMFMGYFWFKGNLEMVTALRHIFTPFIMVMLFTDVMSYKWFKRIMKDLIAEDNAV